MLLTVPGCSTSHDDDERTHAVKKKGKELACQKSHAPDKDLKLSYSVMSYEIRHDSGLSHAGVRVRLRSRDTYDVFVSCFNVDVFNRKVPWLYRDMERPMVMLSTDSPQILEGESGTKRSDLRIEGVLLASGDSVDVTYVLSTSLLRYLRMDPERQSLVFCLPVYNANCTDFAAYVENRDALRSAYDVELDINPFGVVQEKVSPQTPSVLNVVRHVSAIRHALENRASTVEFTSKLNAF